MNQQRLANQVVIGEKGCGQKTITFKEEMFKEELAPAHARIDRFTEKGVNYVRMTY